MSPFSTTAYRSEFGIRTSAPDPVESISSSTALDVLQTKRAPTHWWQRLRPKLHDAALSRAGFEP